MTEQDRMTEAEKQAMAETLTHTVVQHILGQAGPLGYKTDAKDILVEVMRRLLTISRESDEHNPSPPALEGEDA